jgi:predicted permease
LNLHKEQKLQIAVKLKKYLRENYDQILKFLKQNFSSLSLPSFFLKTLELMCLPIVPLMIFSVGLALPIPKTKHAVIAMPAIIIKLCFVPFIFYNSLLFRNG